MADNDYQKLPGGGTKRRAFLDVSRIRTRLWMGRDHLLYQLSTGFTEDYKRFYYGDIQSITIRKTMRFMIWNIVLSAILLICGLSAFKYHQNFMMIPFLYTVAFFSFLFLVINLSLGPTCVCHLYTQVSAEELYSLKRLRTARKLLKIISPLIEEKQRERSAANVGPSTLAGRPEDHP